MFATSELAFFNHKCSFCPVCYVKMSWCIRAISCAVPSWADSKHCTHQRTHAGEQSKQTSGLASCAVHWHCLAPTNTFFHQENTKEESHQREFKKRKQKTMTDIADNSIHTCTYTHAYTHTETQTHGPKSTWINCQTFVGVWEGWKNRDREVFYLFRHMISVSISFLLSLVSLSFSKPFVRHGSQLKPTKSMLKYREL